MNKYVGVKYKDRGRTVEEGLDCFGLVKLYLMENFGIELENFNYSPKTIQELIDAQSRSNDWEQINLKDVKKGDVIVLRQFKIPAHIAVMDSETSFIHSEEINGVSRVSINDKRWNKRIVGAFRHKDIESVKVAVIPGFLKKDKYIKTFEGDINLHDLVLLAVGEEYIEYASVKLMGKDIPPEIWKTSTVKNKAIITIELKPKGGSGKAALATALSIAVTMWAGGAGGTFMAHLLNGREFTMASLAIARAVTTAIGMLAINAIVKPPTDTIQDGSDATTVYSITGMQNRERPYGAVTTVVGRHRVYPDFACRYYTETIGNDQYINCLFAVSIGDVQLSDFRIGDDPLSNFTPEPEIEWGITDTALFNGNLNEQILSLRLTWERDNNSSTIGFEDWWTDRSVSPPVTRPYGDWFTRTTGTNSDSVKLDVTFPSGLYFMLTNDGVMDRANCLIDVHAYNSVSGEFSAISSLVTAHVTTNGFCNCPDGQYKAVITGGNPSHPGSITILVQDNTITGIWTTKKETAGVKNGLWPYDYGVGFTSTPTITCPPEVNAAPGIVLTPEMVDGWLISRAEQGTVRESVTFDLPSASQWDIKLRQKYPPYLNPNNTGYIVDECYWSAFSNTGASSGDPINVPYTLTRLALRIKATDQLYGMLRTFNCIADSGHSNPADAYRYLLQGEMNASPVDDSKIDLTKNAHWHSFNSTNSFGYNAVYDNFKVLGNRIKEICTTGRASYAIPDGLHSVVVDEPQSGVWAFISSENCKSFRGEKQFVEQPHALRCKFVDAGDNWQNRERIVYADGYNSDGSSGLTAATVFQSVDFPGVTDRDQIWKLARYLMACGEYQTETWTFIVDVEHLTGTRGDKVTVQHHVPKLSLLSTRVKKISQNHIEMWDEVVLEIGKTYSISHRSSDNTITEHPLVALQSGTTTTIELLTMPANISTMDVIAVFETGIGSIDGLISKIVPLSGKNAQVTCLPYNENIYLADSGAIPPFVAPGATKISVNPPRALIAGEYMYVSDVPRQGINFSWQPPLNTAVDQYQTQMRTSSGEWESSGNTPNTFIKIPDIVPGLYDLRVRTLEDNMVSEWATIFSHEVRLGLLPPVDVTGLIYIKVNGYWYLRWAPITDSRPVSYEVRFSVFDSGWDGASILGTTTTEEIRIGFSGYFYVKAFVS